MLNEKELAKIFTHSFPALSILDVHWRTQDSTEDSLLFYKFGKDPKSIDLFENRIKNCKFKWLVTNQPHEMLPENSTIIDDSKWMKIQSAVLDILYPLPDLKLIALTGTNGKTTTTDLVLQLGTKIGKKGFSIGTLGVREYNKTILDFGLTSPGFVDLRKFLNRFGTGKDFCVLEASSHALEQDRLHGLSFDGAGWLSFSQDHLDYHKTMDEYFKAKCLLIGKLKAKAKLFVPAEQESLFLSLSKVSQKIAIADNIKTKLPLFFQTQFNKNNLEVAQAIVEEVFGMDSHYIYSDLHAPDGRFYIRSYGKAYIVVDFAHTPDALENICSGIRQTFPNHSLKVLFGCGGDRDRSKRSKMAEVVDKWADQIYVTSDNPRSEDPSQIIKDILKGISKKPYLEIVERPKAVQLAFSQLKQNEVLLLAGKGHEDYILINGVKYPYSDIVQVDKFLENNKL